MSVAAEILNKLIDEDLLNIRDYPDVNTCYEDAKNVIVQVLKDYIIIKGEIIHE